MLSCIKLYFITNHSWLSTKMSVLLFLSLLFILQVALFLNRALNDPLSFYCMVNCHLLDYEVCRVVENRLSNTTDDTVKDYGLAFICAEEKRNARICLYLGNHLVKNPLLTDLHTLSHYVLQMLTVPEKVTKTACSVDKSRYCWLFSIFLDLYKVVFLMRFLDHMLVFHCCSLCG